MRLGRALPMALEDLRRPIGEALLELGVVLRHPVERPARELHQSLDLLGREWWPLSAIVQIACAKRFADVLR